LQAEVSPGEIFWRRNGGKGGINVILGRHVAMRRGVGQYGKGRNDVVSAVSKRDVSHELRQSKC
jgi:hypothetical protein